METEEASISKKKMQKAMIKMIKTLKKKFARTLGLRFPLKKFLLGFGELYNPAERILFHQNVTCTFRTMESHFEGSTSVIILKEIERKNPLEFD